MSVHDSAGKPLAGAAVYLQFKGETQGQSLPTDAQGQCRFTALHPGSYSLRAQLAGYPDASYGPFAVQAGEHQKNITLTFPPPAASQKSAASLPFFDQPQFTIAGVTDPTNLGGHGSNATAPAKDELTREVVSLGGASSSSAAPSSATEPSLRQVLQRHPDDFDANHRLGKLLLGQGRARQALPYLRRASRLNPADYQNNYQLALAYTGAGQYDDARATLQPLLAAHDSAGLHHLLGDVEEKSGQPLAAAREYERAAQLAPSEANLFDWGAELLLHRAPEPALEVFNQGHHLFPNSVRMLLGIGAARFAQGSFDQAARYFCQASDLDPANPQPYLFLGQLQEAESTPAAGIASRLARFARLRPDDAQANYYYALSLWKGTQARGHPANLAQVSALLQNATRLDPAFAAAYLQLGVLYAGEKRYPEAISSYERAIAADPRLPDAHYRLAQAYMRAGDQPKARAELQLYDQLTREQARRSDRERSHIQQFVYTLRTPAAPTSAH